MAESQESPQTNSDKREFTPKEETEITAKWYGDTSFEGRTKAEFDALRQEVKKATILDFEKLRNDRDYSRLIYENPFVDDFLTQNTMTDLSVIHDDRDTIGLSESQFEKLVAALGPEVQAKWRGEIAKHRTMKEALQGMLKQFTPEEIRSHRTETTATMKKEIELQEKNIPHQMLKPALFPKKKKLQ